MEIVLYFYFQAGKLFSFLSPHPYGAEASDQCPICSGHLSTPPVMLAAKRLEGSGASTSDAVASEDGWQHLETSLITMAGMCLGGGKAMGI